VDEDIDDVAGSVVDADSTDTADSAVSAAIPVPEPGTSADSAGSGASKAGTSGQSARRPSVRKAASNGNGRAAARSKPAAEPAVEDEPGFSAHVPEPERVDDAGPAMPADEIWSSAKFASPTESVLEATPPPPVEPWPAPGSLLSSPPMPSDFSSSSASARYVASLGTEPPKPSFTPVSAASAPTAPVAPPAPAAPPANPAAKPPTQAFPRPAGVAAAVAAVTAPKKPKAPRAPKPPKATVRKSAAREAHLTIARVEPWSVMKFSFAVSVVSFIILFVAVAVLYGVLSALGVFTSIQHLVSNVTSSSDQQGVDATKWFSASRILGYTVLLGGVNIVLITALSTIGAVIYNLTTRLIGGVEVTLKEAD
jgi:hypothetical protein